MIQIANPIYDVVFKFMMSDNKVAKLILSTIIGDKIIDLTPTSIEYQLPLKEMVTVFRLNFQATIETPNQVQKTIHIKLLKAKFDIDVVRFMRHLNRRYPKQLKQQKDKIYNIYFLGHLIEGLEDIPVIKVARNYIDIATNNIIEKKTDFIESLTHNSYVIQIPYVHQHRRTDLEQLLYIFGDSEEGDNESLMTKHFLKIIPEEVPERYQPVLRRLIEAFANPKVRETMEAEDDILEELQDYTRLLEEKEEELKRKELKLQEKDTELREKDTELQKKDEAIIKAIKKMLALNISAEEVAEMFGKSIEFVEQLK